MGPKVREIGELWIKLLWGNALLPVWRSARAASYDLCAASSCVIPSQSKSTIETRLAVSLPLGTYAHIAPRLRLATRNFIDIGVGVVDSDYWAKIKVIHFNHFAEDFVV